MQEKYGEDVKIKNVRSVVMELAGGISGGTIASALNIIESFSLKDIVASQKAFGLSPIGKPPNYRKQPSIVHDTRFGGWLGPWLMSNVNAAAVCRTYGLLQGKWGDKFSYKEYMAWGSWLKTYMMTMGLNIGLTSLAFSPVRWLVRKFVPAAGEGPSEEALVNGKFEMKIIAETDEIEPRSGSITVHCDGDPAYFRTGTLTFLFFFNCSDDVD